MANSGDHGRATSLVDALTGMCRDAREWQFAEDTQGFMDEDCPRHNAGRL